MQGIGPTNFPKRDTQYRNMIYHHKKEVPSNRAITAFVSALYSCEDSITANKDSDGKDTNDFGLNYEYGAWNKQSAMITNDVRKLETFNPESMEVLIDSVTLEKTPADL
jgi:hypothetical protein